MAESNEFQWQIAEPAEHGMNEAKLQACQEILAEHNTKAFVVVRNDRVVWEWYASDMQPDMPHGTASLAKALVGAMSLSLVIDDGLLKPDDPVCKYVPSWRNDPLKSKITIRHLATHTSGMQDAQGSVGHFELPGWKGEFWRQDPDPFTVSRDKTPVMFEPGSKAQYSNPGMAMLSYAITAALQGSPHEDVRSLLRDRIMNPLGIKENEWSIGYGKTFEVEGFKLVPNWGGAAFTPRSTAKIGRLMLRKGNWEGKQLLSEAVVEEVTRFAGMPNSSGLSWWLNQLPNGNKKWAAAPSDAFYGIGANHQFLLVIPSLQLIAVRNGRTLDDSIRFHDALRQLVVEPLMDAVDSRAVGQ